MFSALQVFVVIACVIFCVLICVLVSHRRLLLRYSLIWLLLAVVVALAALFPAPLYALSGLIGFASPSNFIFFAALFALMAIALSLSIVASRQARKITSLIQDLALASKRIDALEKEKKSE